ncbi:Phosphomevalonate kinase [Yarrowia sp. C11]|nr:Phosphomevalonate kinase [Yarrowia sp. E02]KAG5372051.1 Phosphomevalonate kinase [Yarrowia sp. C11]
MIFDRLFKHDMTTYSAPGKALLCGGYLVIDPAYSAYVVGLSARIYATVSASEVSSNTTTVTVTSPQFENGEWIYQYTDGQLSASGTNPFAQAAVNTVLHYVSNQRHLNIHISIKSDNAYHSQIDSTQKGQFAYHKRAIQDVPKTGLGSSAALTTVLVAALLKSYGVDPLNQTHLVHNLSQVAHCSAQKKIGSGFDVASAVCGSLVYRRFPVETVDVVIAAEGTSEYAALLQKTVDTKWEVTLEPSFLPPGITLLMGDVQGGSETPGMVAKVMEWRKTKPREAAMLWKDLNAANMLMVKLFNDLRTLSLTNNEAYQQLLADAAPLNALKMIMLQNPLGELARCIVTIRKHLKKMTRETGAAIEPDEQSALLNKCNTYNGVIGGVVPGAGGYDAISLLVISSAVDNVKSESQGVQWMQLREENEGLKLEKGFK